MIRIFTTFLLAILFVSCNQGKNKKEIQAEIDSNNRNKLFGEFYPGMSDEAVEQLISQDMSGLLRVNSHPELDMDFTTYHYKMPIIEREFELKVKKDHISLDLPVDFGRMFQPEDKEGVYKYYFDLKEKLESIYKNKYGDPVYSVINKIVEIYPGEASGGNAIASVFRDGTKTIMIYCSPIKEWFEWEYNIMENKSVPSLQSVCEKCPYFSGEIHILYYDNLTLSKIQEKKQLDSLENVKYQEEKIKRDQEKKQRQKNKMLNDI